MKDTQEQPPTLISYCTGGAKRVALQGGWQHSMNTAAIWEARLWCVGEGKEQVCIATQAAENPRKMYVHTDVPNNCVHIDLLCMSGHMYVFPYINYKGK